MFWVVCVLCVFVGVMCVYFGGVLYWAVGWAVGRAGGWAVFFFVGVFCGPWAGPVTGLGGGPTPQAEL